MRKTATAERPILFSSQMIRAILQRRKTQTRRMVKPQPTEGWRPEYVERYRPCTEKPNGDLVDCEPVFGAYNEDAGHVCPYGGPGDRLWVRESWRLSGGGGAGVMVVYRADEETRPDKRACKKFHLDELGRKQLGPDDRTLFDRYESHWHPSIHMRREFCRIALKVASVRCQRLQDISVDDVWAEGIQMPVSADGRPLIQLTGKIKPADYVPDDFFRSERKWDEADRALFIKSYYAALWDTINGVGSWASNPWVWAVSFKVEAAR
jgi:hypothetical protein